MRSKAPSFNDPPNVVRHYYGNMTYYGLNMQGACARNRRFVGMAAHVAGATNTLLGVTEVENVHGHGGRADGLFSDR